MSRAEKIRLFDLPNSMQFLDDILPKAKKRSSKLARKQTEKDLYNRAADYALTQNPQNAIEFTNQVEFYKAHVKSKIDTLSKQYEIQLQKEIEAEAINLGLTIDQILIDNKKYNSINQKTSEAFFQDFDGNPKKFNNPTEVKNEIKNRVYQSSEMVGNPGKLNESSLNEALESYKQKVKETENRIGTIKINANLTGDETIQQIKKVANELKFASESAATYHALKHYNELPLSHQDRYATKFENYYQSAIQTIKESSEIVSSYNQNGNRSFIFKAIYSEGKKTYKLQSIVSLSPNGNAKILTYFSPTK